MLYDAFICHASEDKAEFVRPLAEALSKHHLAIWYDELSLSVGDSLRQAIDEGLSKSRFGIVVLSRPFFKKGWAQRELDGLVARQIAEDRRLILPIWHNITQREILEISPPLADVVAISSVQGVEQVCKELAKRLRPEESPLIAARDELLRYGYEPPVISDEWWLDIVEQKETDLAWRLYSRRWLFPLPYGGHVTGKKRGLNIAWTAMQLGWSDDAEDKKICQITPPEDVHRFIESHSGLAEICQQHVAHLAGYVPQLLIPEFSGQFADDFDFLLEELLKKQADEAARGSRSGIALTTDGNVPVCDAYLAFRHPTFGNHKPERVADKWMNGFGGASSAQCFEPLEYAVWLLSRHSDWLPTMHRECLIEGLRAWGTWANLNLAFGKDNNLFLSKLYQTADSDRPFCFDASTGQALHDLITKSFVVLNLQDDVQKVADLFIERQFIEGFLEFRKRTDTRRRSSSRRQKASGSLETRQSGARCCMKPE